MKLYTVFALLLLTAEGTAKAQSGGSYKLNWDVPGEELIYRSCGCADACWVAEVRSVRKLEKWGAKPLYDATVKSSTFLRIRDLK